MHLCKGLWKTVCGSNNRRSLPKKGTRPFINCKRRSVQTDFFDNSNSKPLRLQQLISVNKSKFPSMTSVIICQANQFLPYVPSLNQTFIVSGYLGSMLLLFAFEEKVITKLFSFNRAKLFVFYMYIFEFINSLYYFWHSCRWNLDI